jgi:phosphoribosyl-ATP pyrophosphohydrolase
MTLFSLIRPQAGEEVVVDGRGTPVPLPSPHIVLLCASIIFTPEVPMLPRLFSIIEDRKLHPVEGSYTNQLFRMGEDEILKKIGEESVEVILAAKAQGDERLLSEMADLYYHTLVLLSSRGLSLQDVEAVLETRHQPRKAE